MQLHCHPFFEFKLKWNPFGLLCQQNDQQNNQNNQGSLKKWRE